VVLKAADPSRAGGQMRLAKFILQDMEAILAEWEAFAATLLPAAEGDAARSP